MKEKLDTYEEANVSFERPIKAYFTDVDRILSINITEQCNLQCVYCYQNQRRNRKKNLISLEVATDFIRHYLTRKDDLKRIVICLIGGEVLLYSSFVRDLITWTLDREHLWKNEYGFFIDTNGTLLNDDLKDWFYERRNRVTIGLSLDGTPEAHNLNRSGSYALVAPHIPFVAATWPNQPAKMTISPLTIPMIFDGILHIMDQGIPVLANVPMENIWGSPDEKSKHVQGFKREIEKLVDYFASHPERPLPNLIDLPIAIMTSKDRERPWCGAGRNMVAIDIDGKKLPCSRFSSMSFDQDLFNRPLLPNNSSCRSCFFTAACQTCEALNWEVNGNPQARTSYHCEFTKWQIWGTAQIHTLRLEKRLKEIMAMPKEEKAFLTEELSAIKEHLSRIAVILNELEQ